MADEEVRHVSETAPLAAGWRAMESERADALFHDPLAAGLAGERASGLHGPCLTGHGSWPSEPS